MSAFADLEAIPPFDVWPGAVRARRVEGERMTMSILELAPDALVPEHHHDAEQIGVLIRGRVSFTIDGETRELAPGATWKILSQQPHEVRAGSDGAIIVEAFAPPRRDWDAYQMLEPQPPLWPPRS
jgi:unsaturated pyranuronate lyase